MMFPRIKSFVKNHWKKVVVGGVAIQLVNYGLQYASKKIVAYHEDQAKEIWRKVKKQQHFETMDSTCISSYKNFILLLQETICRTLDSDFLTQSLKNQNSNKLEIWHELKIIAFSRAIASIYGSSILFVLLRIQLSILGGYLFLDGAPDTSLKCLKINSDAQERYLSLARYFSVEGMERLSKEIYEKTKLVVGEISLKRVVNIRDIEQLFWAIITELKKEPSETPPEGITKRNKFFVNPIKYSWKYIFSHDIIETLRGMQNDQCHIAPPEPFDRLVLETNDLLESEEVLNVLKSLETLGVSYYLDRLGDLININSRVSLEVSTSSTTEEDSIDIERQHFTEANTPMAKVIPPLNALSVSSITDGDPWLDVLCNSQNTKTLSANIYESFSNL